MANIQNLIDDAKCFESLSSYQLARDLELNQKTAWYMQQRIRAASFFLPSNLALHNGPISKISSMMPNALKRFATCAGPWYFLSALWFGSAYQAGL